MKKPAIVTFVVDLSGSMKEPSGATEEKLIDQVKKGLIELLNAMAGPGQRLNGQPGRPGHVHTG